MLRSACARASTRLPRTGPARRARPRFASPFSHDAPAPPPPPPPRVYIQPATVYPFILLSILTSLALNLGHQRAARETEAARARAQISVLESILARLPPQRALSPAEQADVDRELELVGLGRAKDKAVVGAETSVREPTSWSEVLFGKKGKGYEPNEDEDKDWEKVFREADEAEKNRQASDQPTASASLAPPASLPLAPPPAPTPVPTQPSASASADPPGRARPVATAMYL